MQIDDWCRELSETSKTKAEKVPILPEVVDFAFLSNYVDTKSNKIPIGVDVNTLQVSYYPVFDKYISLVLSSTEGHCEFVGELTSILSLFGDMSITVIDVDGDLDTVENVNLKYHINDSDTMDRFAFNYGLSFTYNINIDSNISLLTSNLFYYFRRNY